MDLGKGILLAWAIVSLLTFAGCYLVALVVSAVWEKLWPSSRSRPRPWLLAVVLYGCLGGGGIFLFDAPSPQADPLPLIIGPDSP